MCNKCSPLKTNEEDTVTVTFINLFQVQPGHDNRAPTS